MNEISDLSKIIPLGETQLDLLPTLFNFFVCVLMAFIVRSFYVRRSYSLTGKTHIGSILPILSLVVFMVIVVVKSSLALSLGLVGALSIVRFRTPIKEPEELVYLFLAIAIGLGYGAGHTLITTCLTVLILLTIYIWLSNRTITSTSEYNLVLNWKKVDVTYESLIETMGDMLQGAKLIRLDCSPTGNTAVMLVTPNEKSTLDAAIKNLRDKDPELSVTFFEAKTNW